MNQNPKKEFKILTVDQSHQGVRLDKYITEFMPEISRSKVQKYITNGKVKVNDTIVKKRYTIQKNDIITIDEESIQQDNKQSLKPENIDLEILYEDDNYVAINKPAGMVVHPGNGNYQGTLANALLFRFQSLSLGGAKDRPGIVHRLDKNTTGIIVVAKNDHAHHALSRLFANREVKKEYIGICIGLYPQPEDTINAPIGRKKNDPLKWCVNKDGKEAITEYKLLIHHSGLSLMQFKPYTGRTHQIRVHCSYAGFPIIADNLYGGSRSKVLTIEPLERIFVYKVFNCFNRHALHARKISFIHPFTQKELVLTAPYPEDMKKALLEIERKEERGDYFPWRVF